MGVETAAMELWSKGLVSEDILKEVVLEAELNKVLEAINSMVRLYMEEELDRRRKRKLELAEEDARLKRMTLESSWRARQICGEIDNVAEKIAKFKL